MQVTFFLHGEPDLARLEELDPDRNPGEFRTGERAWILQTYLRLREAGHPARLSDAWPGEGILVFSSKQRRVLGPLVKPSEPVVLVGCREDVGEAEIADFEVVQNGFSVDRTSSFFIPLWPQPGLVPRDPDRGARIRSAVFKGFARNLHPAFASPEWSNALAVRGIEWIADAAEYAGPQRAAEATGWESYRDVDLVVAVRPPDKKLHERKPATKLTNAWLAGVPAILGPELAYRELRRSDLDYMEVKSVPEALAAVDRLIREPALYAAMVENGRRRAEEFTVEAVRKRWVDLLYRDVPARAGGDEVRFWRGKPVWLKAGARRIASALGRR
jgi:hypothetical protein